MLHDAEAEASFRVKIIEELRRMEDKIDAASVPAPPSEHHRTAWQVRMGDVTTIIAVLGLVWTASQAFGRLDSLDKSQSEVKDRIKPIEQIGWKVDALTSELDGVKNSQKETGHKVSEIHETLIRMGVTVAGKQK